MSRSPTVRYSSAVARLAPPNLWTSQGFVAPRGLVMHSGSSSGHWSACCCCCRTDDDDDDDDVSASSATADIPRRVFHSAMANFRAAVRPVPILVMALKLLVLVVEGTLVLLIVAPMEAWLEGTKAEQQTIGSPSRGTAVASSAARARLLAKVMDAGLDLGWVGYHEGPRLVRDVPPSLFCDTIFPSAGGRDACVLAKGL